MPRKIQLLNSLKPEIETVTITKGNIKPTAAVKQILTLGLRTMQPSDYYNRRSYVIPGRMHLPDIRFTCTEEDFYYFKDRFASWTGAPFHDGNNDPKDDVLATYENDTYELQGFFMYDGPESFSDGCICTASYDSYTIRN